MTTFFCSSNSNVRDVSEPKNHCESQSTVDVALINCNYFVLSENVDEKLVQFGPTFLGWISDRRWIIDDKQLHIAMKKLPEISLQIES